MFQISNLRICVFRNKNWVCLKDSIFICINKGKSASPTIKKKYDALWSGWGRTTLEGIFFMQDEISDF